MYGIKGDDSIQQQWRCGQAGGGESTFFDLARSRKMLLKFL